MRHVPVPPTARRPRAGGSLIEVLVAMAVLGIVMVGILQVFSLSLLQGEGSAARTQLSYKCQQVVEILRTAQFVAKQNPAGYPATPWAATGGITYPLTTGADQALPYTGTEPGYAFWGPAGANIIERPNDTYRLYYTVEAIGTTGMQVRVTAYPADAPGLPTGAAGTPSRRFLGKGSKLKVVDYVAQISNS